MADILTAKIKVEYDERIKKAIERGKRIRRAYRWTRAVRRHGGR